MPKLLAFSGSLRSGSWNAKLVEVVARGARQAGAEVTVIALRDYPLPVFDEDLERDDGTPESAARLKELFAAHDGLLVASPEYNSSITAALKNAIDWVSRPEPEQPPLFALRGKVAGLVAASPGALGGLRGLVHVRAILGNLQVTVHPNQFALPQAHQAFDDAGDLADPAKRSLAESVGADVARMVAKLRA